jgi:hypothetical protein
MRFLCETRSNFVSIHRNRLRCLHVTRSTGNFKSFESTAAIFFLSVLSLFNFCMFYCLFSLDKTQNLHGLRLVASSSRSSASLFSRSKAPQVFAIVRRMNETRLNLLDSFKSHLTLLRGTVFHFDFASKSDNPLTIFSPLSLSVCSAVPTSLSIRSHLSHFQSAKIKSSFRVSRNLLHLFLRLHSRNCGQTDCKERRFLVVERAKT